jgi:hypothetical protein
VGIDDKARRSAVGANTLAFEMRQVAAAIGGQLAIRSARARELIVKTQGVDASTFVVEPER